MWTEDVCIVTSWYNCPFGLAYHFHADGGWYFVFEKIEILAKDKEARATKSGLALYCQN